MVILHIPVHDLIVSLSLCLTDASETSQATTGDNSVPVPDLTVSPPLRPTDVSQSPEASTGASSIATTFFSVAKDDLNILSNGNITYTCP